MAKAKSVFIVIEDDKHQYTLSTMKEAEDVAWDGCKILEVVSVTNVGTKMTFTKAPLEDLQ